MTADKKWGYTKAMTEQEVVKRENRRKRRLRNQILAYASSIIVILTILGGVTFGAIHLINQVQEKKLYNEQLLAEQEEAERIEAEQLAQAQLEAEQAAQLEEETTIATEDELLEELIAANIADMSIEDKVAGLFMITPEQLTGVGTVVAAGDTTKAALAEYPVGGLIYFSKNIVDEEQLKEMIQSTLSYSKYPLFIGVDEEGGSVSRLAGSNLGIEEVVAMGEIGETGDSTIAEETGTTIGQYLAEYGFNVDFAPVADVLTEEDSPIGDRSFGTDAVLVSEMVSAFVTGLQSTGVSATVKHFPGHGGTTEDSHNELATTTATLEELQEEEFLPFISGIEAGVEFVMVGHISAPNVIGDNTPSSLSSMMISEVLRGNLGYNGIVVTDALNMSAITDTYTADEAAVLAIQAGVDIILMPEDFELAYLGIIEAVAMGKITEERIDESLKRIYRVKYKNAFTQ